MPTESLLNKINLLSKEQYDSIAEKKLDELYAVEMGMNGLDVKGVNPLLNAAQDTTHFWRDLGPGVWWYSNAKSIWPELPSDYGFFVNYVYGSDVYQMFKLQRESPLMHRSGNHDGWGTQWDYVANSVPAGTVIAFAAITEPAGNYLLCNGAAVNRNTYYNLFMSIGTTYGGGDGSTTFNLPDLRGRYIEGQNTAAIGTYWNAGLPNITGQVDTATFIGNDATTGAFRQLALSGNRVGGEASGQRLGFSFNASYSNSIYGNSTTVQPPAVTMRYYIKY